MPAPVKLQSSQLLQKKTAIRYGVSLPLSLPKKNLPVPLTAARMSASLSLGHLATGLLRGVSLLLNGGTWRFSMRGSERDVGGLWEGHTSSRMDHLPNHRLRGIDGVL
jgi:hypothetical protein